MGVYVARRLLNYAILLFIAVSLTYLLAATQLHPRPCTRSATRRSTR